MVGKDDEVISDADLYQLLDRSELYRQWEDQKLSYNKGNLHGNLIHLQVYLSIFQSPWPIRLCTCERIETIKNI